MSTSIFIYERIIKYHLKEHNVFWTLFLQINLLVAAEWSTLRYFAEEGASRRIASRRLLCFYWGLYMLSEGRMSYKRARRCYKRHSQWNVSFYGVVKPIMGFIWHLSHNKRYVLSYRTIIFTNCFTQLNCTV